MGNKNVCMLSRVQLFATPWTDCSPPGFSVHGILRQEYWSGLPFPPPQALSNPGIKPTSLGSPAVVSRFFSMVPPGKPMGNKKEDNIIGEN